MSKQKFSLLRNPNTFITLSAIIISLCALMVSVQQTSIMNEERELMYELSRKSVWPRISWSSTRSQSLKDNSINQFSFILMNQGIGPAIIKSVRITYKGEVVNNWWHLFKKQNIPDSIPLHIGNKSFNNRILRPGEEIVVLNLTNNLALANEVAKKITDIKIQIYYESIYNENWVYDNGRVIKLDKPFNIKENEKFKN